jgi:hypothetical protein
MVLSLVNDKNCFGSAARDFGHRRLPVPPASTMGLIIKDFLEKNDFFNDSKFAI